MLLNRESGDSFQTNNRYPEYVLSSYILLLGWQGKSGGGRVVGYARTSFHYFGIINFSNCLPGPAWGKVPNLKQQAGIFLLEENLLEEGKAKPAFCLKR